MIPLLAHRSIDNLLLLEAFVGHVSKNELSTFIQNVDKLLLKVKYNTHKLIHYHAQLTCSTSRSTRTNSRRKQPLYIGNCLKRLAKKCRILLRDESPPSQQWSLINNSLLPPPLEKWKDGLILLLLLLLLPSLMCIKNGRRGGFRVGVSFSDQGKSFFFYCLLNVIY